MKAIQIFLMLTLLLTGCSAIDALYGVDEEGKDLPGTPPIELFSKFIQNMGPLGTLVVGALTVGGSVYVGNKKNKGVLTAVIDGVEKVKNEMGPDDSKPVVALLKKHIPNKFHKVIDKIRDTL